MAQLFSTGPVAIYVGLTAGTPYIPGHSAGGITVGTPVFLGHSEKTPNISVRPQVSDAWSDIGGQRVAFDKFYDSQDALVSVDLTRFNYPVYQAIADRAAAGGPRLATFSPGVNLPGEIGSLMMTEGLTVTLWLRWPYSAKPAYAAMPGGLRFPATFLQGPDDITSGTVPHKIRCVWYCMRQFNIGSANSYGAGSFTLYDYNMNGLPPIN